MNLHGKTALVTGSTSGIGLGIARCAGAGRRADDPQWLRRQQPRPG